MSGGRWNDVFNETNRWITEGTENRMITRRDDRLEPFPALKAVGSMALAWVRRTLGRAGSRLAGAYKKKGEARRPPLCILLAA